MKNRLTRLISFILMVAVILTTVAGPNTLPVYAYTDNSNETMVDELSAGENEGVSIKVKEDTLVVSENGYKVQFDVVASVDEDFLAACLSAFLDERRLLSENIIIGEKKQVSVSYNCYDVTVYENVLDEGELSLAAYKGMLDEYDADNEEIISDSIMISRSKVDPDEEQPIRPGEGTDAIKPSDFPPNTKDNDLGLIVSFGDTDIKSGIAKEKGYYYSTGKAIKPSIVIFDGNVQLKSGKDYKIKYKNNKSVCENYNLTKELGEAWVENIDESFKEVSESHLSQPQIQITGAGTYKGLKLIKYFNIIPADFDQDAFVHATATIKKKTYATAKKAFVPKVTVSIYQDGKKKSTLKAKKDYVTYFVRSTAVVKPDGSVSYNEIGSEETYIPAYESGLYKVIIEPTEMGSAKIEDDRFEAGVITVIDKKADLSKAKITFKEKKYNYNEMGSVSVNSSLCYEKDGKINKGLRYWTVNGDGKSAKATLTINGEYISASDYTMMIEASAGKKKDVYIVLSDSLKSRFNYDGMEEGRPCKIKTKLKVLGISLKMAEISVVSSDKIIAAEKKGTISIPYNKNVAQSVDDYVDMITLRVSGKTLSGNKIDYEIVRKKVLGIPVGTENIVINGFGVYSGTRKIKVNVSTNLPGAKQLSANEMIKVKQFGSDELVGFNNDGVAYLKTLTYRHNLNTNIQMCMDVKVKNDNGTENIKTLKLKPGKDYSILTQYERDDVKVGTVTEYIDFKGDYSKMPSVKIRYNIVPQVDPASVYCAGVTVKADYDLTEDDLIYLAYKKIKVTEFVSRKILKLGSEYTLNTNSLYNANGKQVTEKTLSANQIYFMSMVGRGNYEGMKKFIPVCYSVQTKGLKVTIKEATLGCKGDVSYIKNDESFLYSLPMGTSLADIELRPIEGYGDYQNGQWVFDSNYYGAAGTKKINVFFKSGLYKGKYVVVKYKTAMKNKKVDNYNYIKSFLGLFA